MKKRGEFIDKLKKMDKDQQNLIQIVINNGKGIRNFIFLNKIIIF